MPIDGEYDDQRGGFWDATTMSWSCGNCLAVLGSMGCCRFSEDTTDRNATPARPHNAPAATPAQTAKTPAKHAAKPRPAPPRREWKPCPGPFEVRGVDEDGRKLFLIQPGVRLYAEACTVADVYREECRFHVVVWWPEGQRVLYDSREMPQKWPWSNDVEASVEVAS